jgi:hypothetical protein
VRDLKT